MKQASTIHDLIVAGGGINGAGIAADAAGRGLDVVLCEMNDLASATSSASTKLIHGGLRYLEQYEFRLVREALAEREILLHNAPHIIGPMRFQLPHQPHLRPRWMIRAGLYLYDFLSHRVTLPASKGICFGSDSPLVAELTKGFEYSDAWVDDARLVVLVAMQAREHGAQIRVATEVVGVSAEGGVWTATLRDKRTGETELIRARALINATGPWVGALSAAVVKNAARHTVRLVKGCHIVVPKIHDHPEAFLLQNVDGRVVFVIPYEQDFSLIGTTEEDFGADPSTARISESELEYLISIVNKCFKNKIAAKDVVHHFAGVRPLVSENEKNASRVSRDYTLDLDFSRAPLLTVYGGKITTYRRLAEHALEKLADVFPGASGKWTAEAKLPGGDFQDVQVLVARLREQFSWISDATLHRWARSYGTLAFRMLSGVTSPADMGADVGQELYVFEIEYLCRCEWARTADDILWRRSKLGLRFNDEQCAALTEYLDNRVTDFAAVMVD